MANTKRHYDIGSNRSINHTTYYESPKLIDQVMFDKVRKNWEKGIRNIKLAHEQKKIGKTIMAELFKGK